ncbi:type II toxin-antitoxin system HicA family toxin [Candidatus Woesearchaeota archaeon]|nr:type II toxin-antitoxin system HicA family toxin [Candidatus Woesearchaeota archaeon]
MKLPLLNAKELCRILGTLGFQEIRQKGSHKYFRHPDGRTTVIPMHPGRDIGRGLLRRILNEIQINREEFLKLIK